MKKIWQYFYYYLITPLFLMGVHLAALFSSKIRRGLIPRYKTINSLKKWLSENNPGGKRILFHTASMGEYEHIRPVLQMLKEKFETINIVTFFSPSGYENVGNDPYLDFHLYMPFDRRKNWQKIFKIIEPSLVIIAKWDVWPGQIWTAKDMNIPLYLINASLREDSGRTKKGVKRFLKHVFRDFSAIFAVSEIDGQRFSQHYPRCPVEVVGDTKYDQVVLRKKHALAQSIIPDSWMKGRWILVAGSIWSEDEEYLFPAIKKIMDERENIRIMLVPHQPEQKAIENIIVNFAKWGVQKFSKREILLNERVLVIDAIGYLAGLYHYAHCAYVGGSFRQGIHNVMEPAVFGIPVLYGPVHENSHEAVQFSKGNGGFVVKNANDIYTYLTNFWEDDNERILYGKKSEKFALRNTGATEKIIRHWHHLLKTD